MTLKMARDPILTSQLPDYCSVNTRTFKRIKPDQNGPNQQIIKLNFEDMKRDVMELDQQIGREIDLMVVKLAGLDGLKNKLRLGQESLESDQGKLTTLSSEETWAKIKTTVELSETLHAQTKAEWEGHHINLQKTESKLPEFENKLVSLQLNAKDREQPRRRTIQEINDRSQRIEQKRANLLAEKEESLSEVRKVVMDSKIELKKKVGELKCELQAVEGNHSMIERDRAELEGQQEDVKNETIRIESQIDRDLLDSEECLESIRTTQRKRAADNERVLEEYNQRSDKLERQIRATQDEVDQAYCKLRAAEEVAASVKEFFLNIKREHRTLVEQVESTKQDNEHYHIDLQEKKTRIAQKYKDLSEKNDREVTAEEVELNDAIEQIKKQENILEEIRDENINVEKSIRQVRVDEREAEKMTCRVKNRLYDEKQRVDGIQKRNQSVCRWKLKFQDSGITPHLYLEKLRRQMQEINEKMATFRTNNRR